MFSVISAVVVSFQDQQGTCTHVGERNATREELEEAIKQVGILRTLTQTYAKERFLFENNFLPEANLTSPDLFERTLKKMISGWTPWGLPAPPSQNVTDRLLDILDGQWSEYKEGLEGRRLSQKTPRQILQLSEDVEIVADKAVSEYVNTAYEINQDVPGLRASLASEQDMNYEKLAKEAVYMATNPSDNRKRQIEAVQNDILTTHL